MNFFEYQDKARRNTFYFYIIYLLILAVFVTAITLVHFFVFPQLFCASNLDETAFRVYFNNRCVYGFSIKPVIYSYVGVILIVAIVALFRRWELSSGGLNIAQHFAGRIVHGEETQPELRMFHNVVQEMSLASGCPMPITYLVDNESINAFAAGTKPENAVVAVTQGALNHFNRDELQAVVAHEFSHVLNKDMRLNIELIAVSHGILFFYSIGRSVLRSSGRSNSRRSNNRGGGGQILLIALGFIIVGSIGYFLSLILKFAVSRQREYLADASAVQFTRNPQALTGALLKIKHEGSLISDSKSFEVAHMFFAKGFGGLFSGLFATHPPIDLRLKSLGFDPKKLNYNDYISSKKIANNLGYDLEHSTSKKSSKTGFSAIESLNHLGTIPLISQTIAKEVIDSLSDQVVQATKDSYSVRAAVFAILLSNDTTIQETQYNFLNQQFDSDFINQVKDYYLQVKEKKEERLAIIDLSLPALRMMSKTQLTHFMQCLIKFINIDKHICIFEYTIYTILKSRSADLLGIKKFNEHKKQKLNYIEAKHTIASALISHMDLSLQRDLYILAMRELDIPLNKRIGLEEWNAQKYDQALYSLGLCGADKIEKFIKAITRIILSDQKVASEELEILRGICERLEIPMPLFRAS